MTLSANKILERNPTEIDWWVHGACWVLMLGFAPASLHPTYELRSLRDPLPKGIVLKYLIAEAKGRGSLTLSRRLGGAT